MPHPPRPKEHPILGHLLEFRENRLPFLLSLPQYGDITRVRLGHDHVYTLHHPDLIHQVLVEKADKFQKLRLTRNLFQRTLNSDALLRKTQAWKQRRESVQAALHAKKVEQHAQTITRLTKAAAHKWPREIDIYAQMRELTLNIVAKTLFGSDVTASVEAVMQATSILQEKGSRRFNSFLSIPLWIPTPNNRKVTHAVKTLDRVIDTMMRDVVTFNQQNLIRTLLNVQDKNEQISRKDLREELVSLMMSGHETTATALTWVWVLLAQNPPAREAVRQEIDQVVGDQPITMADLPRLIYTEAVVKEAMRLYPPSWLISRRAVEDVTLGGTLIPKGAGVFISPYSLHRDPRWFANPDQFCPERFLAESTIPRCAYLPFSVGPRKCIGSAFAMMEIMLILVSVMQEATLDLTAETVIMPEALITLRPKYPIHMAVSR